MTYADLIIGIAELAKCAKVKPDTVQKWRQRHADFPEPVRVLAAGPIWYWPDVEAWLAKPRPSGRRKV